MLTYFHIILINLQDSIFQNQDCNWSVFKLFSLFFYFLGHHVTLLPPIHLSIVIGTESAKMLRHPKEAAEAKDFSQNNANSQGYIYIH